MKCSINLSTFYICATLTGNDIHSFHMHEVVNSMFHKNTGILCQSFSPPSDEICPRDNVTFTCVVNSGVTRWTVGPGDENQCIYLSSDSEPAKCGPGGRFESSRTDVNESPNNSSLSVDLITNNLNGITVSCSDAGIGELTGSYNICIIGKSIYMENLHYQFHTLWHTMCIILLVLLNQYRESLSC